MATASTLFYNIKCANKDQKVRMRRYIKDLTASEEDGRQSDTLENLIEFHARKTRRYYPTLKNEKKYPKP